MSKATGRRTYAGRLSEDAGYWRSKTSSGPDEREYLFAFVAWVQAGRSGEPGVIQQRRFKELRPDMLLSARESAEADANRLAEALEAIGTGANPDGTGEWHYVGCPTNYSHADCDMKCITAREALRKHKEGKHEG